MPSRAALRPLLALPAVTLLACALATTAAAQQPPSTQGAAGDAAARAEVDRLVTQLGGDDPKVRRIAAVRLKNLDGTHFDAIEQAAAKEGLSEDARVALKAAVPSVAFRAREIKLAEQSKAYELKSTLDAYERAGRKDPRWDAAVKEALTLFGAPRAGPEYAAQVLAAFKKASDAGCTDPLVQYLYARIEWLAGTGDREAILKRHRAAALALPKSAHPPEWACRAAVRYMEQAGWVEPAMLDTAISTLPEALAVTGRSNQDVRAFVDVLDGILAKETNAQDAFDRIYPVYEKARPANDPQPHVYKGSRYIDAAWEARGSDIAARVTPQGWELFRERLAVAREALEKAWAADPQDPAAPTHMIRVCVGEGGDKGEMEMWFRRAMACNPNNVNACRQKLTYLLPRWHGSHAEMLFFGRQCVATQEWWGPIPTVLIDAHWAVAKEVPDRKAYFAQPEVWADIESVYRPYLEAFPDSTRVRYYRNAMAKWACDCQQWGEAEKIFAEIGDDVDLGIFRSAAVYNYYRKKARNKANNVQEASARPEAAPAD